ncbi:hypothetical protein [Paracoccus pantotrophus]|uniref:hypothetical protein n=1 Tax=Paracoccus pantotrophus TaxID=82367 RepID=UPI00048B1BF3|nr:hypothetical protein [Paracoccus pantotrophus]
MTEPKDSSAIAMTKADDSESGASPIMQKFKAYQSLIAKADDYFGAMDFNVSDDEMDRRFHYRAEALKGEILAAPTTSAADFAAKMILATNNGELFPKWDNAAIWIEARALTDSVAA